MATTVSHYFTSEGAAHVARRGFIDAGLRVSLIGVKADPDGDLFIFDLISPEDQDEVDAEAWAAIKNDYDPESFVHTCEIHNHSFLTYCVFCPEDTGNGRISEAARQAHVEALAGPELPF